MARSRCECDFQNGVRCKVSPGLIPSVYRQDENLIRYEARFSEEFFKNNDEWISLSETSFEIKMNYLRQKGWSLIERLYWLDSKPAHELSPADAFMQFQ